MYHLARLWYSTEPIDTDSSVQVSNSSVQTCYTLTLLIARVSMGITEKSDFAKLCRSYRVERGLKQRQIAEVAGVKLSTYGNVESSPWKVMRRDRAERLVRYYGMSPAQTAEFLSAWERCPLSTYGEKQREYWQKRHALRSKTKNYDRMRLALVEVLTALVPLLPDKDVICNCTFGGGSPSDPNRSCEVCWALESLGLIDGWQGDTTMDRLLKLQVELENQRKGGGNARTTNVH